MPSYFASPFQNATMPHPASCPEQAHKMHHDIARAAKRHVSDDIANDIAAAYMRDNFGLHYPQYLPAGSPMPNILESTYRIISMPLVNQQIKYVKM